MATVPGTIEDYDGEEEGSTRRITDIIAADRLIELLDDTELGRIGQRCLQGFEADLASRNQASDGDTWEKRYKRYLDIAMQVREQRVSPWPNASNIKFPLLTSAAVQFQARAYPAIVDGASLVKGRVLGNPSPDKTERAERVGQHMTWQLLFDMPGWEEATDRLLLQLPIVGSVFRKTWHDPVQKRNESQTVTALDFVINYWAESIEAAPRYTHIMRFYPHECEERFRSGIWKKIPLPHVESAKDDSETAPVEFLEQFCRIDLDGDDYPEPYIVTLCRETSSVVRIEPAFDEDTVTINNATQEVVRIDPKQYFTQYGFLPAPDGSFYHIGFGALLDDITAAIDKALNHMLDAGALQNAQGGFVGAGVNIRSGDLKFRLGEWKRVDVTGGTLRENIVPLNLPGPSAVLFNLLEMLIGAAKEITAVQDVLTGSAPNANTPATTTLAQIEQATKVMTAIFKRIHRAFGQELRILFSLNRDFLDDKAYYALTDQPGEVGRADYQDKDIDVVPVSDPTMVNDAQKAAKAQALMVFMGNPLVNQQELVKRYLEATGQPNIDALLNKEPPPPDPKLLLDAASQENDRDKTMSEVRRNNASAAQAITAAAETAQRMNLLDDTVALVGAAVKLATDAADMEDNGEPLGQPGNAGGMEESPGNAGVPALPQGPTDGLDGGMGSGGGGEPVGGGVPGGNPEPVL